MEKLFNDTLHEIVLSEFNDKDSWEYNLEQVVRWDTEFVSSDVSFYVRHWIGKIANQEGFILVKKD